MSWQSETKKQRWLKEWYELKLNFRVQCRKVSCGREEILYVSIDDFKKHIDTAHNIIFLCEEITEEKAKLQIRYPGCNNWKYFMLWPELETLPPLLEDPQSAPEMVQYSIKCILCDNLITCNDESARDGHIIEPLLHPDIDNQYRKRNFPDSWPWKYQTKLDLDFFVKCNLCDKCVSLKLSTEGLKKHYEENHKEIWKRKFKQEEARDQPGPSAGPSAGTSARSSARSSARPSVTAGPSAEPRQPQAEKTLQTEFKKHSWMTKCYDYQPNTYFNLQCRNCNQELKYVRFSKFKKHMEYDHKEIFDLEEKKCEPLYYEDNWIYFMQTEQGEIKCLMCLESVTDDLRNKHVENHKSNHPNLLNDNEKFFCLIHKNWLWKYMEYKEHYSVKCKLCKPLLQLESNTHTLKNHYERLHLDEWKKIKKDEKDILEQGEARDQPGPSAGPSAEPRQPQAKRTLQTEFKEHSWMTKCYDYQPNPYFNLQCRIENCNQELRYVDIGKFREHIKLLHNDIFDLEEKKRRLSHFDFKWRYFMINEHRKIECLVCHNIVDDSINSHVESHTFNRLNDDLEKLFSNITNSWSWKYMKYEGHYSVKCIICDTLIQLKPVTKSLKKHYTTYHLDEWKKIEKDEEEILEQEKAHDQPGPSTQSLENRKDRTLKSEFEEHSWLKRCYDCQSDSYFCVRCLEETCDQQYVLYVKIDEFAKHMKEKHEHICEIERKQCSLPNHDISNWIYFMHRGQGKIECLVCEHIIGDKYVNDHADDHVLKAELEFSNWNKRFNIIQKDWRWKYQRQISDYIAKCRLCGEDSPEIHLTPNTEDLQKHYNFNHGTKWNEIILPISLQEEMQKQAGPPHKVQKTS